MAQTPANSCLVCNSLLRSKRRRRELTEATITNSGREITICARIEVVLDRFVRDSTATAICESCYSDLDQIENLVRQFRRRYQGALQTRSRGSGSRKKWLNAEQVFSQNTTGFTGDVLVNLKIADSGEKTADAEVKEEVKLENCDFQERKSVELKAKAKTPCVEASKGDADVEIGSMNNEDHCEENSKEEIDVSKHDQSEEWVTYKIRSLPKGKSKTRSKSSTKIAKPSKSAKLNKPTRPAKNYTTVAKHVDPKYRATYPHCGTTDTKYKIKLRINKMDLAIKPNSTKNIQEGFKEDMLRKFPCLLCSKRFRTSQKLRRHKAHHRGRKPYICVVCGKCFLWSWHLKKHMVTHTSILPYTCCETKYTAVAKLALHMVSHKEATSIKCPVCSEKFPNYPKLREHRKQIHGGFLNECPICGQVFKRANKLKLHIQYHESGGFKCDTCLKIFKTKSCLEIHKRLHTGDVYTCEECGKSYATLGYLHVHRKTHTGERDFLCSVCGKGFSDNHSLNRHTDTHKDKKQFSCEQCGKGFMRSDHLTKHMVTHSDLKPFICSFCGRGFSRLDKMKQHMRTHTKPPKEKKLMEKKPKSVKAPLDPNAPKVRAHRKKVKPDAQSSVVEDEKESIIPRTADGGTVDNVLTAKLPVGIQASHKGIDDSLAVSGAYQSSHSGTDTERHREHALTLYPSLYMSDDNVDLEYECELKPPPVPARISISNNPRPLSPMHSVD